MKAAVLTEFAKPPVYRDFADPLPISNEQLLISVKAAAVKNLDKLRASGQHYGSHEKLPAVVGSDGVGVLEDGKRVYARGLSGMLAQKALISAKSYTLLPAGIDDETAAALPNAVLGAVMPLVFRASIKKGDVVLISGATGVTGQFAIQIAKRYGAGKIICTGRNKQLLAKLLETGADAVVSLHDDDEAIVRQLKSLHSNTAIDIIVDYLWGHPAELIFRALTGSGLSAGSHKTKFVTVGSLAGEHISLASNSLRSADIGIIGSGFGSLSRTDFEKMDHEILPDIFQMAVEGKMRIGIHKEPLVNIAQVWNANFGAGTRLVITID